MFLAKAQGQEVQHGLKAAQELLLLQERLRPEQNSLPELRPKGLPLQVAGLQEQEETNSVSF